MARDRATKRDKQTNTIGAILMTTSAKGAKGATRRASTSKAKAAKASTAPKAKASASKRTASTAKARKANVTRAFVHWPKGTSPYAFNLIPGKPEPGAKGAVLLAAYVVAGYAKLGAKATTLTKGDGGNARLLRAIVGDTAYTFHKRNDRIDSNETLNAAGLNWMNARLAGAAPQNNTDVDTVRGMVQAMTKGGKAAGLEFTREVVVEA